MPEKNLYELICEAIEEAMYLEMGMPTESRDRILLNAMRLSGAPFSFVEQIYEEKMREAA